MANIEFITAHDFESDKYNVDLPVKAIFRQTRYYPIDIARFFFYLVYQRPRWVLFESWLKIPALEVALILALRVCNIKVAMTIHDLLPHYPKPWSRMELCLYYSCCNALIVHSEKQKGELRMLGVQVEPLIVPHGVYDIFRRGITTQEEARETFPPLSLNDFVVLFFGFLGERKGIAEFLNAAEAMVGEPKVRFLVAGQPEDSVLVRQLMARYRRLPNLVVHDKVVPFGEVQRYFTAADIVVLPYREGTTSGVLKLAIAFCRPVLCTNVGDFPETLENWPGLVIDSNRLTEDLVEKIREAQASIDELRARASKAIPRYGWEAISARLVAHLLEGEK